MLIFRSVAVGREEAMHEHAEPRDEIINNIYKAMRGMSATNQDAATQMPGRAL
jgi:hypothetical protein